MKSVIVCPECKKLVYFNSYFGAYICESCGWEDASYAKKRDSYVIAAGTQTVMKVRCSDGTMTLIKARLAKAKKGSSTNGKKAVVG